MKAQRPAEAQHRAMAARQGFNALRGAIFSSKYLSQKDKLTIASACVHSRALHGSGTWTDLTATARQAVSAAYMSSLKRIFGFKFELGQTPPSDQQLCQSLGVPVLEAALVSERLLQLSRIVLSGPNYLWSLIQASSGSEWRRAVSQDLASVAQTLAPKSDALGSPHTCWHIWQGFIFDYPCAWRALVREFARTFRAALASPDAAPPPRFACDLLCSAV